MKERLTNKQLAVYCFMQDFFRENDMLPTGDIVSKHLGATSSNTGWVHYRNLAKKGYIELNAAGKYRFKREQMPEAA